MRVGRRIDCCCWNFARWAGVSARCQREDFCSLGFGRTKRVTRSSFANPTDIPNFRAHFSASHSFDALNPTDIGESGKNPTDIPRTSAHRENALIYSLVPVDRKFARECRMHPHRPEPVLLRNLDCVSRHCIFF
jgi:hypothetical protein